VANSQHDQPTGADYQRQYELDHITAQYEDEYRAGKSPKIAEYIQRYPQFAAELMEFAFFFHTIGAEEVEPDPAPPPEFTAAEQKARARIRAESAPPQHATIEGFVEQGLSVGYLPAKLAEALDISRDVLAKLEAHAVAASTIPQTFIQRASEILQVAPEAIISFLQRATPAQAGGFFYADQAPQQEQESFLEAVQASPRLTTEQKQAWADAVARDLPDA
jgi:hypothetical protein